MRDDDTIRGVEGESVAVAVLDADNVFWNIAAKIEKFDASVWDEAKGLLERLGYERDPFGDELAALGTPYETVDVPGNLLTTAGLNRMTSLIVVAGGQGYNNANSRVGVGNSNTAAAVGQTDLQAAAGSSNRQFQVMDATYPTQANGLITWRSTFATGEANFAWEEWCIDNGTSAGTTVTAVMLNRKVTTIGTKTSASAWVFTVTLTLS